MRIKILKPGEIFVFGSNLAGIHAGGAAKQAHEEFGVEMGVGEGLTGRCYAFPTLDENFQKRSIKELEDSRDRLYECANRYPNKIFILTKVGCGIAGYPEEEMRSLFKNLPLNIIPF